MAERKEPPHDDDDVVVGGGVDDSESKREHKHDGGQTSRDDNDDGRGAVRMPATEPPCPAATFDGGADADVRAKQGEDDSKAKGDEQFTARRQAAAAAAFERSKRKAAEGAEAAAVGTGDREAVIADDDVALSSRSDASAGSGAGGVVTVQVRAPRSHLATAVSAGGGGGIAEMEVDAARSHFDGKGSPSAAGAGPDPPGLESTASSPGAVAVPGYRAGEIDAYRDGSRADLTTSSSAMFAAPPPRRVRETGPTDEETATAVVVTATAVVHDDHDVAAAPTATGPVVEAKPLDDDEIRALEGSKPEARLRRRRRRRFWTGVLLVVCVGVVLGVAVPLSLQNNRDDSSSAPPPPPPPRPTSCEGYETGCASTYEELVDGIFGAAVGGEEFTVAAICDGADIVVEREMVVQRNNLTVCCAYPLGASASSRNCTLRGGDAQLRQILQVAGDSLHLLDITFDMQDAPSSSSSPRPEGTRNGNVNVNGAGTHVVDGCTFVGGVAVQLQGNGGNFNLDGLGVANLTVTRSVFGGAVADRGGGGVFLTGLDGVEFSGCTFDGNGADYGGGFAATQLSTISIQNSTFRGNNATGKGGAGWIRASDGHVVANNSGDGNAAAQCDLFMDTVSGDCLDFDGNVVV